MDHFGIFGDDVNRLADQWRGMGFYVVGPAELEAVDEAGESHAMGQQSAHVMFADHYLELTSVTSPQPGHHLQRFFDAPKGIRLILLRSPDITADQQRCSAAGLQPGAVQDASRKLDHGARGSASFRWFALPADQFADALVCFVEHLTPEKVFDPDQRQHPNSATGITRIGWLGDDLPENYHQLHSANPIGASTSVMTLPQSELESLIKTHPAELSPWAVLGVHVEDPGLLQRLLEENHVPHQRSGSRFIVQPKATGGVLVVFESKHGSC